MAFLLAEDKFLKIKRAFEEEQNQPKVIQELMLKLLNDLKICDGILLKQEKQAALSNKQEEKSVAALLAEKEAARINALFQNHDPSQFFISLDDDDDDDNYDKESIISLNADMFETPSCDAITTPSIEEPEDSLIMEDEDIDTILEKESDE
ncbi:hypothetical protein Tco_1023676 [Tanacetum coccineum]